MERQQDLDQNHDPAVQGPNSVPTGSRFDTSTEPYAAGFPNIPDPEWLSEAAKVCALARGAKEVLSVET